MANYTCPECKEALMSYEGRFFCIACDEEIDPYSEDNVIEPEIVEPLQSSYIRMKFNPVLVDIDGQEFFFPNKELAIKFAQEVEQGHAYTQAAIGDDIDEMLDITMEPVEVYTDIDEALEVYLS